MEQKLDQLSVNTIRNLTLDAVQRAHHGHLGMPLGAAPMGYILWRYYMSVNPEDPTWFDRDRFVLSAGHGSMLLYALLHLSGFPLTIEDIKQFRQLNSITPGHPEYKKTIGVDASTGPLGQGFAMGVGMAIAEAHLADRFNQPHFPIVNHYTYVISGDGDFEEGVCQEAASVAGNLGLNKLIVLWDANQVTSDAELTASNTEDEMLKFEAMGWNTIEVHDGNNCLEIKSAIAQAKRCSDRPTLIKVNTIIGYGSRLAGTSAIHSDPVSDEEAQYMKKQFGFADQEPFYVPDEVAKWFDAVGDRGVQAEETWLNLFEKYRQKFPDLANQLTKIMKGELTEPDFESLKIEGEMATRAASGQVLNTVYPQMPILVGGSGDLGTSNKTTINDKFFMAKHRYWGPNIYFGIREFAMAAIANGITLHGGLRGYTGTFLVFSDYMRSAIRQAAIMGVPTIFVFTHDSLYVGQDGPTHQPVEQLMSLRAMPNINVFRAADDEEVKAAWQLALAANKTPTAIILNRQAVPQLAGSDRLKAQKGAYVISEAANNKPTGIIIATGSEVALAIKTQEILVQKQIFVRVVSMPSWELFALQSAEYQAEVLPDEIECRMSIELGATLGWQQYVGLKGVTMGYDHFGESAPAVDIIKMIDFNPEHAANLYVAAFA
ncbi:transketolase [Xylocopilactobacillus apicola]|uniref:Transketolase n=1 Tax=Xylocopilactobacillus apicola TaxID=2932184 RepID=A0AAU9DZG6_9LACO|nr:transketolase [Xylocopilactobacillus apicola]BDR59688.1 transketolase [Xylocopilactobacillus apicola]